MTGEPIDIPGDDLPDLSEADGWRTNLRLMRRLAKTPADRERIHAAEAAIDRGDLGPARAIVSQTIAGDVFGADGQ